MTFPPSFGQSANPYAYKLLELISDWGELELCESEGYKNYGSYPTPQPWPSFYPSEKLLEEIAKAISVIGAKKIEYGGLADAEILKLFCTTPGVRTRVWDWFEYWQFRVEASWDVVENGPFMPPESKPPEWMRNMMFVDEGSFLAGSDFVMLDCFRFPERWRGKSQKPLQLRPVTKCVVVAGLAADLAESPKYDWQKFEGFSVGIIKDKYLPEWERWIEDHPEYEHAYEF